jgi:hypothetical protein
VDASAGMNKTLGNQGGPWPLIVGPTTWQLSYPDEGILSRFVVRAKQLALTSLDAARKQMSAEGFAVLCAAVNAELGVKRLYEWGGTRCNEALSTTEGLSYLLFLMLQPSHRELTEADALRVLADALQEDAGVIVDGVVIDNPYIVRTLLEMADQGKSRPATGTPAHR